MSRLVDFYRGEAADAGGRVLEDLWGWGDDQWEEVHDFIQWLFPLPEPSRFNADAPQDIAAWLGITRALRSLTLLGLGRKPAPPAEGSAPFARPDVSSSAGYVPLPDGFYLESPCPDWVK